jgi:probable rRNA maturation factor
MTKKSNVGAASSRDGRGKMPLPPQDVVVDVDTACKGNTPEVDFIETWVRRAVAAARVDDRPAEVSVRIVNEDEIRNLNRDYRQRDYATNVLSFPAGDIEGLPEDAAAALGDVVICAAVVANEAAEQDKALDDHWAHMLVHGTLHLIGFDHETEVEAAAMEALEVSILAASGVANPYQ